jgi:hypothetical protein
MKNVFEMFKKLKIVGNTLVVSPTGGRLDHFHQKG